MQVQASLKSSTDAELIPIGEAAKRLGLTPSALRYYEERGLVAAQARQGGRRMYGSEELRRLAFVKIVQRLGVPLEVAAAILDAPGPQWRTTVRGQIDELTYLIEQAKGATTFLTHSLACPTDHPARDCPTMTAALDQLVTGRAGLDQLAEEHGHDVTPGGQLAAGSSG